MQYSYNDTINSDSTVQLLPTNFIRSGFYHHGDGVINYRNSEGDYWETILHSVTGAKYLYFDSDNLGPQTGNSKGRGMALRCLVR